ncbi:DUF6236 family protein [Roseovarius amoyensis]|uniref:DUF6236 family protein n=1 Tax=Roseovarius amoyensis TaxID=2211448 RepID=UPI0013A6CEFE|nr:DUF6236 family protein [Roseovarius amoyensis]
MGEAKRRKASDPYFGMRPKNGRGILLSAPIVYDGKVILAKSSSVDPAELRRATLFWDRLVWPDSKIISLGSNDDEKLLEAEGLLTRPRPIRHNDAAGIGNMQAVIRLTESYDITIEIEQAKHFVQQHVDEFIDLERDEPGQWTLSQGDDSFVMKNDNFIAGRGQLVTLVRSIPLPGPDYPLHDLLEFKQKRSDEIVALTHELDKFFSQIANAKDTHFEMSRLLRVVDKQCSDMIKVAKESKRKFYVGDLSFSLSLDSIESAKNRIVVWEAAGWAVTGLPLVGGILGGATSLVSFSRGIGAKKLITRNSPFKVVSSLHKELV